MFNSVKKRVKDERQTEIEIVRQAETVYVLHTFCHRQKQASHNTHTRYTAHTNDVVKMRHTN